MDFCGCGWWWDMEYVYELYVVGWCDWFWFGFVGVDIVDDWFYGCLDCVFWWVFFGYCWCWGEVSSDFCFGFGFVCLVVVLVGWYCGVWVGLV